MIRCSTRNPRKFKLRCYGDFMVDLNYYLAVFPGVKSSDKIGEK